jgi:hypothetical protein
MPNTVLVAIAGAAFGACGGAVVAYTTFIAFGLWPAHWGGCLAELLFGGFAGLPFGLILGGSAGVFVSLRARRLDSLRWLMVETASLIAAATVFVTEYLFSGGNGYSYDQRLRVGLSVSVVAVGLTAVGMQLLKPLYWRR